MYNVEAYAVNKTLAHKINGAHSKMLSAALATSIGSDKYQMKHCVVSWISGRQGEEETVATCSKLQIWSCIPNWKTWSRLNNVDQIDTVKEDA